MGWSESDERNEHAKRELVADVLAGALTSWQPIFSAPMDRPIWLANENMMRLGFWTSDPRCENFGTIGGGWIDKARAEGGGSRGLTFAPLWWHPIPNMPTPNLPAPYAPEKFLSVFGE